MGCSRTMSLLFLSGGMKGGGGGSGTIDEKFIIFNLFGTDPVRYDWR
jgi:hypothetical protein